MPTLRERLGSWIGGSRKATNPIAFHPPGTEWYGVGIGNQPSHRTLLQENIGIFDTGTRAIANRIASLNPLVKVSRRREDGTTEDEILDDHVLKILLDRPHPNYSCYQMLRLVTQNIITVGEAYLLKVGNRLGVPTQLHPMPPWFVEPQLSMGVVWSYRITDGSGQVFNLPADTVVRIYFPDPESPWTSEGYLGPSGITADAHKFANQHLRAHFQNDATPKTYLETSEEAQAFTPQEKERFYAEWTRQYHRRLGSQTGNPAILPIGYKLMELAIQNGADITPLLEHWRDDLLMSLGVPRSILGQVVSGDRSSAETNQYVFDKHTVLPIATLISDALTHQLAPDFDSSIFVEFEKFVSDDKRFTLDEEIADLTHKVRSINQVRLDRGLDPVDWGEEPVGKLGEVPYDAEASFSMPPDGTGAIEDDDEPPEEPDELEDEDEEDLEPPRTRAAVKAYFAPRAEWARQVQREKKFMPPLAKAMRLIFREQQADVLAKLEDAPRARVKAEDIFEPTDPRWAKRFAVSVEPIREAAFLEIFAEVMAGFGIEEFYFSEVMREVLAKHGAELVKHTGRTTKKRIAQALAQGTEAGEGVGQIAKRIKGVFAERRNKHAVTIARTEIGKAATRAHLEGYAIAGVEKKRWNDSMDDAVRDSHRLGGQVRRKGEPFRLNDGELADGPREGFGGTALSAGNSINCRCFLTPVYEG